MKKILFLLLLLSGCGKVDLTDFETETAIRNTSLGTFEVTLHRDRDVESQYSAQDLARIAQVTVEALNEAGRRWDLDEYKDAEQLAGCLRYVEVFAVEEEDYTNYCPDEKSIACFNSLDYAIYLAENGGYQCVAHYPPGHEMMHQILTCLGHPGNGTHAAPHVFAWNPTDGISGWAEDTAETIIELDPRSVCMDR